MENEILIAEEMPLSEVQTESKRFTILGVEFVYLYLFGIGTALLGWVAENAARLATQGILDCRFHMLPFISPYALIPFAFHIALGDPDSIAFFGHKLFKKDSLKNKILSNILCFTLICTFVFLGELAIGNMWDYCFGVQLWNYSSFPLQVTQYAGLIPTLGYGGGAYLIFRLVYKPLMGVIRRKVNYTAAKAICATLGVAIVLDTLIMAIHIAVLGQPPVYWSVKLW